MAVLGIVHKHVISVYGTAFRVENLHSIAKVGYEQLAVSVISDGVDRLTVNLHLKFEAARIGVIAEQTVVCTNPETFLAVPVDNVCTRRCFRVSANFPVAVKPIYAVVLYGAPGDAILALTDGGHRPAYVRVLLREVPCCEFCLSAGHKE